MNQKYLYVIIGILSALLVFFVIKSYVQAPYQVSVDTVDGQQGNQNTPPPQNQNNVPPQNNPPANTPPTYSTTLPQYIGGQAGWPPVIQVSSEAYSCESSHSPMLDVTEKVINNRNYCITTSLEAAAGQRYGQYKYTRANGSGTKTTYFTLRWPNCGGYGGPGDAQYNQCQSNQNTFFSNLDLLIDSLM